MEKLKECPFCGAHANIVALYDRTSQSMLNTRIVGYQLKCSKCRATMRGKLRRDVMKSWNRRAE